MNNKKLTIDFYFKLKSMGENNDKYFRATILSIWDMLGIESWLILWLLGKTQNLSTTYQNSDYPYELYFSLIITIIYTKNIIFSSKFASF